MIRYVVSGYFINGLQNGHKVMLQSIKNMMKKEDELIVIINNEVQQKLKYKTARRNVAYIYENIKPFCDRLFGYENYFAFVSIDKDRTVRKSLSYLRDAYGNIVFVNDGGEYDNNLPEKDVKGIQFLYLGNPKISSSGEEKWN